MAKKSPHTAEDTASIFENENGYSDLPGSRIDISSVKNMDALPGKEHDFGIIRSDRRQKQRAVSDEEQTGLIDKIPQTLGVGAVLEGTVKNIADYGLFINLGNVDGLVHVSEISWNRVRHPPDTYRIGDRIKVKVLRYDSEKDRLSLSIKQLSPDPWAWAEERYPAGTKVRGCVSRLAEYGAFVEVEEGVVGLIHVSEMSWQRNIEHPSQVLSVGDTVEPIVLKLDVAGKRMSLSIKRAGRNPWDLIKERYPVGTIIEGRIKKIADFGLFIEMGAEIDGFVHVSNISWTKRGRHASEIYKIGQEVQSVVLGVDKQRERFSLGIRQLSPDPWIEIFRRYRSGTRVIGTVTGVTHFGIFLELEEDVEGLIHVSELPKDKGGDSLLRYRVDDVIEAIVLAVSQDDKRIELSVRKLEEER